MFKKDQIWAESEISAGYFRELQKVGAFGNNKEGAILEEGGDDVHHPHASTTLNTGPDHPAGASHSRRKQTFLLSTFDTQRFEDEEQLHQLLKVSQLVNEYLDISHSIKKKTENDFLNKEIMKIIDL